MKVNQLKQNKRFYQVTLFLIVIAIVFFLDFCFIALKDNISSDVENRNLQQKPKLTLHSLTAGSYEQDYEKYISDQFPFRNGWVRLGATASRIMGKTEANGIFLAKNGYLIQNFTEPDKDKYSAIVNAMKEISEISDTTTTRAMIIPTAVVIYEKKLPFGAVTGDQNAFLDQLKSDLTGYGIDFIDTRKSLSASKEQLYYRTDHHWTTFAAYIAYKDYLKAIQYDDDTVYEPMLVSDSFHGTLSAQSGFRTTKSDKIYIYRPSIDTDVTVTYVEEKETSATLYDTEHLQTRNQYDIFLKGNHPLVAIDTAANSNRKLLILKDSYANCFIPFLIPDYQRIVIVDPRYYTDDIKTLVEAEEITDILFLYNATTLAADTNLSQLLDY